MLFRYLESQASHCSITGYVMPLWGDIVIVVGFQPPQYVSLPPLDSGCPIGLYNKEHAYADEGDNIIYAYMQLLRIRIQQSDRDSYSELT